MITDAHHHFFTKEQYSKIYKAYGSPDILKPLLKDFSPSDLKPLMDKIGVDQTILIQTETNLKHTFDLLKIAEKYPWVAGVVGWVDLKAPQVGQTLDSLESHSKFKGIRHPLELEPDSKWVMSDDVLRGLQELAKRGLIYDLLVGAPHLEVIPKLAKAVPDLSLVIEHFAKPDIKTGSFEEWGEMMGKAAQFPKVSCKLSGIMVLIPEEDWRHWEPLDLKLYVDKVIDLFGVERVMFGSDWPVCTLVGSYEQVFDAVLQCIKELSEDEQSKILSENANRIYKLL